MKRLPPLLVRSLLHPMLSDEEAAGGSVIIAAEEKTGAPSRKARSGGDADGK